MSFADRLTEAYKRAGFKSQAALAAACGVTPGAISQLINGPGPMHELLLKVAESTSVSHVWLRTGDPAKAPAWADPVRVIREAAERLSDSDRMRLNLELATARREVAHAPEASAVELFHLRMQCAEQARRLAGLEQAALGLLTEIQALRSELETGEVVPVNRAASGRAPFQARPKQPAQPSGVDTSRP